MIAEFLRCFAKFVNLYSVYAERRFAPFVELALRCFRERLAHMFVG